MRVRKIDMSKLDDDMKKRFQRPPPLDGYMRGADLMPTYKIDPETGEAPVPKEGDDISPWKCDACMYEHNMKWGKGRKVLFCYQCDNWCM